MDTSVYVCILPYTQGSESMALATGSDFSSKVLEACEAGDVFVKEFYSTIDKRRTVQL